MMNNNRNKQVILASQSPRRVALLQQMGISCIVAPANIDEIPLNNELPTDYVVRLAKQKALATLNQLIYADKFDNPNLPENFTANLPVIGADTTVVMNGEILAKPENDIAAFNMLKKLSGATHLVHTAVAVAFNNQLEAALNTTKVTMMPLSDAMIASYIASNEHADKAGSYAIQGLAGCWVTSIEGSYTGVMGLPVHETALLLDKIGY
jgi:septum formation protein